MICDNILTPTEDLFYYLCELI